MFTSARLKLTLWYLLIIMLISLSFSFVIYRVQTKELDQVINNQRIRIEGRIHPGMVLRLSPDDLVKLRQALTGDSAIINEAKDRLKLNLWIINLTILFGSALAGYFLAGRTLLPIQDMVDDQKRFISDASHELRTPITALKTETEVGLSDKKLNLTTAKNLLKSNLEELDKISELIKYFLNLSKYEDIGAKLVFETVNLKKPIEEAISQLKVQTESKRITITSDLADVSVAGNLTSLTQLTTILLDNAIKYSPEKSEVKIKLIKKDQRAQILVQDFGLGIKASDLPHIFNRFYRADTARSKQQISGYGLGLAIAKSIAERHQGKISAESELGKGSIFFVNLPLKPKNN